MKDLINDWKINVFKQIQYDLKNLKSNSAEEEFILFLEVYLKKWNLEYLFFFCEIEDGN